MTRTALHSPYDRTGITPGIVHFGVGGFHRAHEALYMDELFSRGLALDWGIVGVGTMPADAAMRDVMEEQSNLYTLAVKNPDGSLDTRTVGSIIDYLFAPDDSDEVLRRLTDPQVRIVSLTVTEGGYHVHPVTGEFDGRAPDIAHDLAGGSPVRSVFGFITEALRRRRDAGIPQFTVMSCDNLPGNGDIARTMISAFAAGLDPELGEWIRTEVSFPNCMVDRITPVTTDADIELVQKETGMRDAWPVVCEPWLQWVLEDRFPAGRPPLEDVGVQIVDDVVPYELMKLRLLNASHQALCYLGALEGFEYAHEVAADPLYAEFLLRYMTEEATPTLQPVPGIDLADYRTSLIARFANPHVRDTLARLCAETSDRIPKFLLPVLHENLASGGRIDHAALVLASWARYSEGIDEHGTPFDIVDPMKDELMAAAAKHDSDILAFVRDRELFGGLVDDERFTTEYAAALRSLRSRGARETLKDLAQR